MPAQRTLTGLWDRAFYGIMIRLQTFKVYRKLASRLHPPYHVVEATSEDMRMVRAWLSGRDDSAATDSDEPVSDRDIPEQSAVAVRHYVAKSLGRIIGYIQYVRYGEQFGARAGYWGSSFRVRIGWRGMGVGEALGRRGRADAKAAGATTVSLVVYADNTPALNLYRKQGYTRRLVPELDEQFQRAATKPGHYSIIMTKGALGLRNRGRRADPDSPAKPQARDHAAPRLSQFMNLRHAVRLVWDSGPGWTIANLVLLLIQGILPLFSLYILKLVVDSLAASAALPDRGPVLTRVIFLIVIEGVITLVSAIARSLSSLVSESQSLTVTDRMQDVIHAKSVEADLEYYENAQYYDTLHRAQQEAGYRPTSIVNGLLRLVQSSITLTAIGALLISLHWLVAVLLVVTAVPAVLARLIYARGLFSWQRERTPADRLSSYLSWLLTRDTFAKEIRLFDLGSLFRNRYLDVRKKLRRERIALVRRRSLIETAAQLLGVLGVLGSFVFMAYRTLQGTSSLGDLVMYYQAFQRAQGMVRDLLGSVASLYEDSLFLSYLYEFLDLKKKVVEPANPLPVPRPIRNGIAFEHVSFRYPGGAHGVIEDISLSIKPGEVIALVGENGSGKTTLCKLLCRLYDPTAGAITLDGVDIRLFETPALRREISVIFQDYARYNLTARENIWVGNVALAPDSGRIEQAARDAGADGVIERLPHGYDTILGKWFENGEELSIGEWQKVALARAFFRDSQIIVLDEPTSAMDAKTEYEVFSRFRELVAGKSAVLVSHRFSTVRMADTIYVLEGGRISERGSHAELMRMAGAYARLFEIQAQHYR